MSETLAAALQVVNGDTPAYQQIATRLAAMIRDGSLPPGERLPPDRSLARELGLSRTTVVAAYDELKAAGLVRGRQGSGTVRRARPGAEPDGLDRARCGRGAGRARWHRSGDLDVARDAAGRGHADADVAAPDERGGARAAGVA